METVLSNESFFGLHEINTTVIWDALSNDYTLYEKKCLL